MQIVKYRRNLPQFRVVENFFNSQEVEKIIDLEELQNFNKGRVGNADNLKWLTSVFKIRPLLTIYHPKKPWKKNKKEIIE